MTQIAHATSAENASTSNTSYIVFKRNKELEYSGAVLAERQQ